MYGQEDIYTGLREQMVADQLIDRGITDTDTLSAMMRVPRHLFVPFDLRKDAYGDGPLPIGHNQTISQPFIVALMTETARPSSGKKVLEVGTGSGYQSAVLSLITRTVYTIEIIPELANVSAERFRTLGYQNIVSIIGDGYKGWPEHAPFDIIIVTAAAEEIPGPLIEQLAENGRLVIPVGDQLETQELIVAVKHENSIIQKRITYVRFVPLRREK